MQAQRSWDTKPELALRSELHRRGLRYRVHRRPLPELRREADVVFARARVAVFLDSCFWHGCPEHASWPKANARWWREKIERNRQRDRDTDSQLRAAGWLPVRVWEHEDPAEAAARVAAGVSARAPSRLRRLDVG
jgi:DNA mismatch endonuclease, patch repair protein